MVILMQSLMILACISHSTASPAENGTVVLFGDGDEVAVRAGKDSARFLLISRKPLGEPIAWGGPIVMNTREELERAFEEYRQGAFVKVGSHPKE